MALASDTVNLHLTCDIEAMRYIIRIRVMENPRERKRNELTLKEKVELLNASAGKNDTWLNSSR